MSEKSPMLNAKRDLRTIAFYITIILLMIALGCG